MFSLDNDSTRIALAALAIIATAVASATYQLLKRRSFYQGLHTPPHSLFWGHLKLMGEYINIFPRGTYPQVIFSAIKRDYGLGDIFYLDLWPFGPRFIVLAAPDAAAIASTVQNMPQSHLVAKMLGSSLGDTFLECTNGELWKKLHRVIGPALTQAANKKHHSSIVDQTVIFHHRLTTLAEKGVPVDFNYEFGRVPFEVVVKVFFGKPLDTKAEGDELYSGLHELLRVVGYVVNHAPTRLHAWGPSRRMNVLKSRAESTMGSLADKRFAELAEENRKGLLKKESLLPIMDNMIYDAALSGKPLDEGLKRLVIENASGLVAAGAGTTADTTSYIMMLVNAHPECLQKLRQEHDSIFGPGFDETVDKLQQDPSKLKELVYTTAVIQETLRLFPIGMLVRDPYPGMTTVDYKGSSYPVKDHVFLILSHAIHHDATLYPEAGKFQPERFLGSDATAEAARRAWRPFERGVRSCLGQSLAMDEMRIALVLMVRWFEFELVDHGPSSVPKTKYTDLDTKIGKHAFQSLTVTGGPAGPVMMKISKVKGR